jgi:hypothetical protein
LTGSALTSTYASLADFVPDDLAARIDPFWKFIRSGGEGLDEVALVKGLTKLAPSEEDTQASEKGQAEWYTLGEEMRAYLDRIAPRKEP